MPIGDIYRVVTGSRAGNQNGLNVSHWRLGVIAGAGLSDDLVAKGFDDLLRPLIIECQADRATWVGTSAQRIGPTSIGAKYFSGATAATGLVEEALLPPQTTGVFKLLSAVGGRGGRGRKYIPFPARTQQTDEGMPTATYLTKLLAVASAYSSQQTFTVGINGMGFDPIIYNRGAGTYNIVGAYQLRDAWGTQRRRSFINSSDDAFVG